MRAAAGCVGWRCCLPGCRVVAGCGCFAVNEDILRAGRFAGDDSPSGTGVQIPGAVCLHATILFGFMISHYERGSAQALWGVYPMRAFVGVGSLLQTTNLFSTSIWCRLRRVGGAAVTSFQRGRAVKRRERSAPVAGTAFGSGGWVLMHGQSLQTATK